MQEQCQIQTNFSIPYVLAFAKRTWMSGFHRAGVFVPHSIRTAAFSPLDADSKRILKRVL